MSDGNVHGPVSPMEEKDWLENIKWVNPRPSWEKDND